MTEILCGIMLAAFFVVMIGVGFYSRKHATNVSGFVLGGRSAGPWLTAFAFGTSYFSAVIFVGYAGQFGWNFGLASTWAGLGNAFIGSLLAWNVLGRRTRIMTQYLDAKTMPDFFGKRFNSVPLKVAASVIVFIFLIPYTASLYNGLSSLFGLVFDIPYWVVILVMAILTGFYVIFGGYMATAINDFIQGIIMLFGICAVIGAVLMDNGGLLKATQKLSAVPSEGWTGGAFTSFLGPDPLALLFVVILTSLGTWGLPQMVGKFYAIKSEKDISDFFALGRTEHELQSLLTDKLSELYTQTMMMLRSCEIDYENPPDISKSVVAVNGVPLGTQDNLFCITGGEGTGKSNYVGAILAGTLGEEQLPIEKILGLEIAANPKGLAVLHYDTEQSEAQLHKNLGKTLRRTSLTAVPEYYHSLYLASLSRKDRLKLIRESMDLFHHKHGGIHLVVIDGIADLIRSANDETESIAIVDELYRLAGIYNTCIICVLHFVPNGIKLRGHIGSELQRKAAGILSIEKDDNPEYSVVKALKVRDGSPLDVPMMLFGWDKAEGMHVYRGEKSKEDKEKRKTDELVGVIREAFRNSFKLTYQELCDVLMREMEIKDRTAKKYIAYMKEQHILAQDINGNYQKGELCRT